MQLFRYRDKPGPGVPEDGPPKRGLALFFDVLYRKFFDFISLSLLFTLFCIPVVTIPAACTALSKIAFLMSRDEHYFLWMDFWDTFKKEFIHSTLLGWLYITAVIVTFASAYTSALQVENSVFLYVPLVLASVGGILLILMGFYIFPMLAAIDLTPGQVVKNSFLLGILYQPYNLLTLLIVAAIVYFTLYFLPFSILILPLFLFMFLSFLTTFCANAGISKYVLQQEDEV